MIEKVDQSFQTATPASFPKLKLCVAENVTNRAVTLNDSAGSFVGATGRYYQFNNSQSVGGGSVFKYADDSLATLIATGTTSFNAALIGYVIRFDLKAAVDGNKVALVFSDISRAQQSTGFLRNDGFSPVAAVPGVRAPDVVAALEAVAAKIKSCLQ